MDQHLGASITLSFSLVVVFAIVLYQPDKPSHSPTAQAVEPEAVRPAPPVPLPPLTAAEPLDADPVRPEVEPPASPAPKQKDKGPEPIATRPREPARRVRTSSDFKPIATTKLAHSYSEPAAPAPSVAVRAGRRGKVVPAHDTFTLALEGETLRDVAIRVYGESAVVDGLWRLNRDLIERREAPLPAGTLLRTP